MSTVADRLHKWAVQELNLASESGFVPDVEYFQKLTKGKNKRLWTYVINHVRNQATVNKIKRIISLKNLMQEKEENITSYNSDDIHNLQLAISKATDKREYLLKSLSNVKERLSNSEKDVQETKEKAFHLKQKTALLELKIISYDSKKENLKDLASQILSYKTALNAYQSVKTCNTKALALPCDFLFEDKTVYNQNYSKVQHLINTCSALFENDFLLQKENNSVLIEKFESIVKELKKNNILFTDFVILLEEICISDLQSFTSASLQSSSVIDHLKNDAQKSLSKDHLTRLKCDYVQNFFLAQQNRKQIEKSIAMKKEVSEFKIKCFEHNLNYEIAYTLLDKMAENVSLVLSNRCLENHIENLSGKTECVLQNTRQQKFCNEELGSVIDSFHNNADLAFCLLYTFPDAKENNVKSITNLQTYAKSELFKSSFPQKECIIQLNKDLISDRELMWTYCKKSNTIDPLFSEPYNADLMSLLKMHKSLNYQSFQNTSTITENWLWLKQKLSLELLDHTKMFILSSDINASETYSKFLEMIENSKTSIEKSALFINDGMRLCQKIHSLMQEWWEQGAQYIPQIEYDGKTLKMWIDILSILSDFEPLIESVKFQL